MPTCTMRAPTPTVQPCAVRYHCHPHASTCPSTLSHLTLTATCPLSQPFTTTPSVPHVTSRRVYPPFWAPGARLTRYLTICFQPSSTHSAWSTQSAGLVSVGSGTSPGGSSGGSRDSSRSPWLLTAPSIRISYLWSGLRGWEERGCGTACKMREAGCSEQMSRR